MNVYVAGKFESWRDVQRIQRLCEQHGHKITFDWTVHALEALEERREQDMVNNAMNDLEGVVTAHVLIALWHPDLMGTYMEIGMALAMDVPVWLVGFERESVFWHLPHVTKIEDEDALESRLASARGAGAAA